LFAATFTDTPTELLEFDPEIGPGNVIHESGDDTLQVQPEEAVKLMETDPLPPEGST
jgi:hypothetical protein